MNLYRVVVSYFKDQLQFMAERGALAMTPGQALDDVISHLQIDLTRVNALKSWVARPIALGDFSDDAQFCDCVGSRYTVRDVWNKRFES